MQNTHDRHVHLNYQVTRAVSSKWVYTTNYIYYISTSNYNISVQFVDIKCADHDLTLQTEFEKTTSKFCKIVLGESKRSHSLAARLGALGPVVWRLARQTVWAFAIVQTHAAGI